MLDEAPTRFIVLMLGRTGSTLLVEALDSHSRIRAIGEAFKHLPKKSPQRQIRRIRAFFENPPPHRVKAFGFKLKHRDIGDEDALRNLLQEFDTRVIHLRRLNRVKHLVSFFNAVRLFEATEDWNLYSDDDRPGSFRLDPEHFLARLKRIEAEDNALGRFVETLSLPTLEVSYEDLLTQRDEVLKSAFRLLGVDIEPVDGEAIKNTPDDLRLVLENFDELRATCEGTPYQAMFDEVLTDASSNDLS